MHLLVIVVIKEELSATRGMLHIFRLKSTTRKKEHEMQVVFAKARLIHFSRMLRFILIRFILFLHSKANDWFLYETQHWAEMD